MARVEWYIDPTNGNNTTGDGTSEATAWESVAHALATISRSGYGDWLNIKKGATPEQSAPWNLTDYAAYASGAGPLGIEAYETTIHDGGRASVVGNGNAIVPSTSFDWCAIRNFDVTDWGSSFAFAPDRYIMLNNLVLNGQNARLGGLYVGPYSSIENCAVYNLGGGYGIQIASSASQVMNCYVHGNPSRGIITGGTGCHISNNIIITAESASTAYGIFGGTNQNVIEHNTVINTASGAGIGVYAYTMSLLQNNYVEGFSAGKGVYISLTSAASIMRYNAIYNCLYPVQNDGGFLDSNLTLAASGLTDVAGGDYTPLASIQAGAWPKTMQFQGQSYLRDIGALQHADPASGGGIYVPRRPRIFR